MSTSSVTIPDYIRESVAGSIRVLHVDDDPARLELTKQWLEHEHDQFHVRTESNPERVLERLDAEDIDCVVSDFQMPRKDGLELLADVREEYPNLPFVLFTGKGSEDLASRAITAGVTDYIKKDSPDHHAVLANRIESAVEKQRVEGQVYDAFLAIETAHEGISLLDEDGEFVYVNEAYADVYGYDREDFIGEHWEMLYPEGEAEHVEEEVLPQVAAEGSWSGITEGLTADGEHIVENHTLTETGEGGLVCLVQDITEDWERRRELERYETVVDTIDDGVYTLDEDFQFTMVNEGLCSMLGHAEDELLGRNAAEFLGREGVEHAMEQRRRLRDGEIDTAATEVEVIPRDDESLFCEVRYTALFDDDGEFRGTAGVFRDITEHKEREQILEGLHRTNQRLPHAETRDDIADLLVAGATDVLDLPGVAVYLVDRDGETLEPVETAGALAEPYRSLPAVDATEPNSVISRAYLGGDTAVHEDVAPLASHMYTGAHLRRGLFVPLDEYGVLVAGDVTTGGFTEQTVELAELLASNAASAFDRLERERKLREREAKLERQNDRLDRFASIASHELQNPLGVAQGFLDLYRETGDEERLERVDQALDRMHLLTEDLLTLARGEEAPNSRAPQSLADAAEEAWRLTGTGNAELRIEGDLQVPAKPTRLRGILRNLFENAVEHGTASNRGTGADGTAETTDPLTVRVGPIHDGEGEDDGEEGGEGGDKEGFYVADSGVGFPDDAGERVFEAEFSTSPEGSGLGLHVVAEIARSHGWSVRATESESGGARFEVTDVGRTGE